MVASAGSIRIWWDDSVGAYRVITPFHKGFVEFLKSQIPVPDRHWDPQTKVWTVAEKWLDPIKATVEALWHIKPNVITKDEYQKTAAPPAIVKMDIDKVVLSFWKLLSHEVAQKCYKFAAMELHPDRAGGSMEKMASLNSLWQRMEKELYGK